MIRRTLALTGLGTLAATVVGTAVIAPAADAAPTHRATHGTRVIADCVHPRHEPGRIIITCGDHTEAVLNIHWATWSPTVATGRGVFVVNDCTPNCASGTAHRTRATLTLSRPVSTRLGRMFRRLTVHYVGQSGPNSHQSFVLETRPI